MLFRKSSFIGLSALLLTGVAAGCSQQQGTGTQAGGTSGSKNKDIKVMMSYHASMEQFKGTDNMNDNKLTKVIREKTGLNVKYESLPKDNPSQKVSIILASGDVPDLMRINGKSDYFKLAQQGAFEPLDELIQQYIPNISSMNTKEVLDAARYEGKIYGLPHRVAQKVGVGILSRSDILQEAGVAEPKTIDEFYAALKTIKEKKNMAPLTAKASNPGSFTASFLPFAGAFGVGTTTVVKNGQLAFSWLQPEYKEFLTTMKKWYEEGLIDQEFSINKDEKDKMINGTAAFSVSYWADAFTIDRSIKEKKNGGALRYIAPVTGKNGQSGVPEEAVAGGSYWVIPKQAKNKQGAAEYISYIYGEEADKLLTYGIEGQDYKMENGKAVQTPEQSNEIPWRTLYFLGDSDPSFFARLEAKGFLPYYQPLEPFKRNREETVFSPSVEAWDTKFTELRNFTEENALKFIMNKRSLDEFDKFVQEFNAKGGKAAIEAMNAWYTKK
ncbi:putative aldouronate transport system substrate-binding protein [Paenibacillus sp. UNCCL117]|uniref:extracellular solute-binding protein n=1 Tax=unclassified Paenibacillus TaxID=185978 RepID=UPI0008901124|nr:MULTISPECIES: extracellular solute-binding protein [unclassified Paenibacillus]SDC48773.1 putative aldouronate transport system substrate-binding protein [Paenibacillus sp. cl123]SFW11881.1 putative aldouronate transport system substrate-binding protein [Paenibacillus sp. UNCCL117]